MSAEGERLREFLEDHEGQIRGVYYDMFYKMGGHNGLVMAIDSIQGLTDFKFDPEKLDEDEYQEILDEVFL